MVPRFIVYTKGKSLTWPETYSKIVCNVETMNSGNKQVSSFAIRWHMVIDRRRPTGERFFAAAELVCLPLSFITFGYMVAEIVIRKFFGSDFLTPVKGVAFERWTLPILTAAAIGYVTNWLAIKMLFEPHEPTWRHWIPWLTLGFWKQGLLPRNKAKMARELGQTFGAKLLNPDKLVTELSSKAEAFLARPEVAAKFKEEAQSLLRNNADAIAAFIVPEIERAAGGLLDQMLAPEKLRAFWDETLAPRLNDEATRTMIAAKLIEVVRKGASEFAQSIQVGLREYIREKIPFGGDLIAGIIVEFFADEETISRKIADWLKKPETLDMLKEKLVLVGEKVAEWFHSREGEVAVGGFATELKGKARSALSSYVKEAIPKLVGDALDSPRLWTWVETSALPALRQRLGDYIAAHGDEMLASFDLPGRIEKEVNALSMADFHALLDRLMAQHLSAIQVLGYILGAIVGALQCI